MKKSIIILSLLVLNLYCSCAFAYDYQIEIGTQKNGKTYLKKYGVLKYKNFDLITKESRNGKDFYIVQYKGKFGVLKENAEILLKPQYDKIVTYDSEYFSAYKDGRCGLYSLSKSIWELKPIYNEITPTESKGYIVRKNDKYGLYSPEKQDWVINLGCEKIEFAHNNFVIKRGGKVFVLNQFLDVIIPPIYQSIEYDGERDNYIVQYNDKWGIISADGKNILIPTYDSFYPIRLKSKTVGYIAERNSKYGIMNIDFSFILTPRYVKIKSISKYDDEFLLVFNGKKYGVIKYDGSTVVKCKYDELYVLNSENLSQQNEFLYKSADKNYVYVFKQDKQYGVMTSDGEELTEPYYDSFIMYVYNKNTRVFVVEKNHRYGVIKIEDGKLQFNYIDKSLDVILERVLSKYL